MIKVIISIFRFLIKRTIRNIYWLYRLSKIRAEKNLSIHFPIIVEGKGCIEVGDNCALGKLSNIGVSENASLNIGNNCMLEEHALVRIGGNAKVEFGDFCKIGANSRIYTNKNIKIGSNVIICTNCSIFGREAGKCGNLRIGEGSHIGDGAILDLSDNIIIGREVAIGPNCTFYTHDHEYNTKDTCMWKGNILTKPISIGDGSWIGCNVTILHGISIGKRVIIAAGSVVTKNLEKSGLYAGVPAKLLKNFDN